MASRSLAYRKLPQRGVPHFMGRASVLARPRAEPRALWKSLSSIEHLVSSALPVVLTQQGPQWCWAAVSQAVLALDGRRTTQQEIVNRHTGRNCPITNGSSSTPGDCTAAVGCALQCDDPHNLLVAISGWGGRGLWSSLLPGVDVGQAGKASRKPEYAGEAEPGLLFRFDRKGDSLGGDWRQELDSRVAIRSAASGDKDEMSRAIAELDPRSNGL